MVSKFLGLWDPFQMAELHGLEIGVILTTYIHWDDPLSTKYQQDIPLVRVQLHAAFEG